MSNKLGTLGYFKKRMRDSGYIVDDLWRRFSNTDPRVWSVVIDPGYATVFCTYYQNANEPGECYLEIYDGGQYIPGRFKIKTSSIETFIEYLNKFGIIHKSYSYETRKDFSDVSSDESVYAGKDKEDTTDKKILDEKTEIKE